VIGLSGNIRIQIFPPRLMWRVIAIRAASIWRSVTQADFHRLEREISEAYFFTAGGIAFHATLHLFAVLDLFSALT